MFAKFLTLESRRLMLIYIVQQQKRYEPDTRDNNDHTSMFMVRACIGILILLPSEDVDSMRMSLQSKYTPLPFFISVVSRSIQSFFEFYSRTFAK